MPKKNFTQIHEKKNFMIDKKRTYHVTQQQFMFVKAKTINELSKTNKKIEHDELYCVFV